MGAPVFDFDGAVAELGEEPETVDFDTAAGEVAPSPALPAPVLDFDAAARGTAEESLNPARQGVRVGAQLNPAREGKAAEMSERTGVSTDAAERNLEALEKEERRQSVPWDEIQNSPGMQRFLENFNNAAVSIDDLSPLMDFRAALEGKRTPGVQITGSPSLGETIRNRFELGRRLAFELPEAAMPMILADLGITEEASLEEQRRFRELMARPIGPTERPGLKDDILGAPVEQLPILARTLASGALGGAGGAALGAGLGSVLPGPGTAAGAATGFFVGSRGGAAASVFGIEASSAYTEFQGLTDADGQPVPPDVVAAAAVAVGAINAGLELAGFVTLARALPGINVLVGSGRKTILAAMRKRMANVANWESLRVGARESLRGLGVEVATEVAQETVTIEAGRLLAEQGIGLTSQEAARLQETAAQTVFAVLPLVGAGRVANSALQRIGRARQNAADLTAAQESSSTGNMNDVSPTRFRELTETLAQEVGIDRVRIPAAALLEHYETAGLTAEDLLRDVPEVSDQLSAALATGSDLAIPVGRYFGTLNPRFGEVLTPDVRLRSEDLTANEADAAEAGLEQTIEEALESTAATPQEVAVEGAARDLGTAQPLFADEETAGMTRAEFEDYQAAMSTGRVRAAEQLERDQDRARRARERSDKAEQSDLNRFRRTTTREVAAEVDARPVHQALRFLSLRVDDPGPQRLDRDRIVSLYGQDWLDALPRGVWQSGGLHPDSIAEIFGYESGYEMVREMVTADRAAEITDGVNARVIEEFGDPEVDPISPEAALDAAGMDDQIRALLIEERALARRAGRGARVTPWKVAQQAARRIVGGTQVSDLAPIVHRDAAQRSARLAVEAVAANDFETAQTLKRQQIVQIALERETRAAKEQAQKNRKALEKLNVKSARERIGKAGPGFLDQIDQLLERFEFRQPPPPSQAAGRDSLGQWSDQQTAEGEEVIAPDWLLRETARAPWRRLKTTQLQELRDTAENVAHIARRKLEISTRTEKAQLETVGERIVETIEEEFPTEGQSRRISPTKLDNLKRSARWFDASLIKPEFLIDALGGGPNSFLRRFVWDPLVAAQNDYTARITDYTEKLQALKNQLPEGAEREYQLEVAEGRLTDLDGTPLQLTKWNVIMVALNTGNTSNTDKLLRGYGWNQQTVDEVLSQHLSALDWKFVQGTWDLINSLWPEVAALEQRVTGVVPPKVEPQTVRTRFGEFRGGYFPVVYDPEVSRIGQRIEAINLVPGGSENYTRATTGHGHTKERTRASGPLRLSESVIGGHIDQVLMDLTHREAIADAGRVLSRGDVDAAMSRALGSEFSYQRFWVPFLKAVARDTSDPGPLGIWNRAARWARHRGTVFKLGFRASTLILQSSGHFNGFRTLQEAIPGSAVRFWLDGVFRAMGRGSLRERNETVARVNEASPFMRNRIGSFDRDVRDVLRAAERTEQITQQVGAFALELIGRVQLTMVDMPIWLAAHRAALDTMDMTENQAVLFADSIVRKSQGGGTKLDQSFVQRGGQFGSEFLKAATMFYSYNSTVYNQLRASGRIRAVRDVPSFLASYAFYIIGPGLYSVAMRAVLTGDVPDSGDDDFDVTMKKKLAEVMVGDAFATVPFVRDGYVILLGERPRSSGALDLFYRELIDLGNVKDGQDLMFDVMRVSSFFAGLPGDAPLRRLEKTIEEN